MGVGFLSLLGVKFRKITQMTKQELIDLLRKILNTCDDLNFLSKLEPGELENLIARMRDRLEKEKERPPSVGL